MVVRALPTGSLTSCNRQPSESDVVHDHIRFRQYQIAAVACLGVRIRTGHVEYTGRTEGGEAVGGSPCGIEFSTGRGSAEMISNVTNSRTQRTAFAVLAHSLMSLLDNCTTSRGGRHDDNGGGKGSTAK